MVCGFACEFWICCFCALSLLGPVIVLQHHLQSQTICPSTQTSPCSGAGQEGTTWMVVNGGPASPSRHYSGYSLLLRCLPERSCHRLPADDLDTAASLCHAVLVLSLVTCSLPIKQCHNLNKASKSSYPVGWLCWSHWLKATSFFSFLITSRLGVLGLLLHWKNYSYGKEVLRYEPFAAHHHTCWISSLPVPNLRHHSSQPRTICTAFLASC